MTNIHKASGFKDGGGTFWINERGKYGVRYQCKTCGKITLGSYGSSAPEHHTSTCPLRKPDPGPPANPPQTTVRDLIDMLSALPNHDLPLYREDGAHRMVPMRGIVEVIGGIGPAGVKIG